MNAPALYITPEVLFPEILETYLYPNLEQEYYWSDCWTTGFYRTLAQAGFISIAQFDVNGNPVLVPTLHQEYARLDWKDIHLSRHVKKIIRRGGLREDDIYLVVEKNAESVIRGIQKSYTPCWLVEPYHELMKKFENDSDDGFSLFSVQLWSGRRNMMLGGELGYTIGATYTSLSGFLDRANPISNNMGKIQLTALSKLLECCGYCFWNLGYPYLTYKTDLGAKIVTRNEFLRLWKPACVSRPALSLDRVIHKIFPCKDLIHVT